MQAVNSHEVSLLSYSFDVITYTATNINIIDTKIWTTFTKLNKHHLKSLLKKF